MAADLPALRAQYAAPDELLVLLVGRLVYEKGFHLALDALAPVVRRLGGVRFVVAGTGTAEAELKRQARRLGPRAATGCSSAGSATTCSTRCTASADLCIVPSIYEPFGLVALEAMASGCLCVVADTGGLREVVPVDGTVGLRFPSRDSAALGRVLERVLTDDGGAPPARRRGARARAALRLDRGRPPDGRALRRAGRGSDHPRGGAVRTRIACRAVFLDAGGVLVLPDRRLLAGALARAGIDIDPDAVPRAHYRAVRALDRGGDATTDPTTDPTQATATRDDYAAALLPRLGIVPGRAAEAHAVWHG